MKTLVIAAVLLGVVTAASAEDAFLGNKRWVQWEFNTRMAYVRGVVDTAIAEGLFTCPALTYGLVFSHAQGYAEEYPDESAMEATGRALIASGCSMTEKGQMPAPTPKPAVPPGRKGAS